MEAFLTAASVVVLIIDYTIKVIAIGTVPENRRPGSSHAWLLLILLLPVIGLPLFLLIGSPWVNGRRHRVQLLANRVVAQQFADVPELPDEVAPDHRLASILALNRSLTSMPALDGNYHGAFDEPEFVRILTAAIDKAQQSVHVELYTMALDPSTAPFFDAMARAVDRGVHVRVLYDHLGSRKYPGHHKMNDRMTADGIEWFRMMPIDPLHGRWRRPDLRNHRKLVIIDSERVFVGSQNLIDPSYLLRRHRRARRHWVDFNIELTGPVVRSFEAVFATDWYTEAGAVPEREAAAAPVPSAGSPVEAIGPFQVVPSGPGFPTEPNLRLFTALIHSATKSVAIVSPYFVPDETLEQAITSAAYRGLSVELFVSEKADQFMVHHAQRSYYSSLLKSGVRIHRLPAPQVLHSKVIVIDDEVAVIGSSNMDIRSFQLDYEVSVLGLEPNFVKDMIGTVDTYRSRSRELDSAEWKRRPLLMRYVDNVMRLTAALQ